MTSRCTPRPTATVPLLLVGGEHAFGPVLVDTAPELRAAFGWSDVDAVVLEDGQHYLVEERPDEIAELIEGRTGINPVRW